MATRRGEDVAPGSSPFMFFGTPAFGYGYKWPARAHASFPWLKLLDRALALAVERVIYLLRGQELQGKSGKVSVRFLLAFFLYSVFLLAFLDLAVTALSLIWLLSLDSFSLDKNTHVWTALVPLAGYRRRNTAMLTHATCETPGLTGDTLFRDFNISCCRYWHYHLER